MLNLGGCDFEFVGSLFPERDEQQGIKEFHLPAPSACAKLHAYGHGPFCKLHIDVPKRMTGLYALVVDGSVNYIGECEDLRKLANWGYGTISPANLCKKGGTSTNCKLNMKVLEVSKAGGRVDQYFCWHEGRKEDRHRLKMQLIAHCSPPWNGRVDVLG